MYWLKMFWLKYGKKKEAPSEPEGFLKIYHRSEKLIKGLEDISDLLDGCEDWKRLSDDAKKLSFEQLTTFYKRSHFQLCCLRDELLLTVQRLPNVRLMPKVNHAQEKQEPATAAN